MNSDLGVDAGIERDTAQQEKLLRLAMEDGDAEAMSDLAASTDDGEEKFALLQQAAEKGMVDAMNQLVRCHAKGLGTAIDFPAAAEMLEKVRAAAPSFFGAYTAANLEDWQESHHAAQSNELRERLRFAEADLAESRGESAERAESLAALDALERKLTATHRTALERVASARSTLTQCTICHDAARSTTFLPCKHNVTCEACSVRVEECPVCRAAIADRITPVGA